MRRLRAPLSVARPAARVLAAVALLLAPAPAQAEDTPASTSRPELALPAGVETWQVQRDARGQPGLMSVDLVDADIRSVLRLFAEVGGLNFVMTDEVKGTVTARLTEVHWEDALATILLAKGLAATTVPGGAPVLKISPFATGR